MSISIKMISIVLIGILFTFFVAFKNTEYFTPVMISLINLTLILFILTTHYFKHMIFRIYYAYHLLTLVLPLVFIVMFYESSEITSFFNYRLKIDAFDLIKSNLLILLFDSVVILSIIILKRTILVSKSKSKLFRYYLSNKYKNSMILIILLISYSMKMYLISIGAWFMYEEVDMRNYAFASTAELLQKLDILVLLYFAFFYKYNKSKKFVVVMILVITLSLVFAIISTSKAKLFMVLIPIVLLLMNTKFKKIYLSLVFILFINSGVLFDYFAYLRFNNTGSLVENTLHFFSTQNSSKEKSLEDNAMLGRIGYQFVVAKAIKVYDIPQHEYQNDYLDNIIGIIPRIIWPDKPNIGINGNQFGHDLGLLAKGDRGTSVGISPVGEAFYELGYLGIVIVPVFLAFILVQFSRWFEEDNWIGFLLSVMLGLSIGVVDKYSSLIPSLIKTFIIFYFFALLLNRRFTDEIKLKIKI